MTQTQIDRAVARATGESLSTIRSLGFSIADPDMVCHDPERPRRRPRTRFHRQCGGADREVHVRRRRRRLAHPRYLPSRNLMAPVPIPR